MGPETLGWVWGGSAGSPDSEGETRVQVPEDVTWGEVEGTLAQLPRVLGAEEQLAETR